MRADAMERRRNILREARRLFAEIGRDVSLDSIAAASTVGIATLYRNFSSREELINAVTIDIVTDLTSVIARIRETPREPALAWPRFVQEISGLNLGALTEVLNCNGVQILTPQTAAAQHSALTEINTELQQFIGAGVVRPEITALSLVASIAVITRPQSQAIRHAVPELKEQLLEAYLSWSLSSHGDR